MKLIIEISDNIIKTLEKLKENGIGLGTCETAILNGTPLPKGHWIDINGDKSLWKCSHCGQHSCCNENFCTDCGADMRGDNNADSN